MLTQREWQNEKMEAKSIDMRKQIASWEERGGKRPQKYNNCYSFGDLV